MATTRQLCVISGKGGTGKTTVSASLAVLAPRPAIFADCDVDAANLHLALRARELERIPFSSGLIARIDENQCILCGSCMEACRFGGVQIQDDHYWIDPMRCEGCLTCTIVCPEDAIETEKAETGEVLLSDTDYGTLVHARLRPGSESSGKLVMAVREKARVHAQQENAQVIVIDGAPGIGCPVIATLSGVDLALLVAEPTPAGAQGLDRALRVAEHFGVPAVACLNRADLSSRQADAIARDLAARNVPLLARIPFHRSVVEATALMRPAVEVAAAPVRAELKSLAQQVYERLLACPCAGDSPSRPGSCSTCS
ncbi:MAG: ATP-binding protein [Planctomycetota bacterium]